MPPRTVPKTSSGKTRRAACRELYLRGELGASNARCGASCWRSPPARWRRSCAGPPRGRAPSATRPGSGSASALAAVPAWVLANVLPRRAAWRAVAGVIRAFFAAVGVPLRLPAREHLPAGPALLAFNHASNLDAIALLAVLPPGLSFVAKSELGRSPLFRRALRRLGVLFVERFDPKQGVEDTARLEAAVRGGASLVVFPEGTNRRIPGLFPFHLGAFQIAARTGAPIVPGGIVGTRTVLRADQAFPRRAPIDITSRPRWRADGESWDATLGLRDRVREAIAKAAGEALVG